MKIIIAGAGEVGYHVAQLLAHEAHDIVVIDTDKSRLEYVESNLDLIAIRGDSTSFNTLKDAQVARADLLIAATSAEATNLTTAIIGKRMGARKTIARIDKMEYLIDKEILDLKELGIDELISPESLAAREIKYLLKESASTDTFEFENGKLTFSGIQLDEASPLIGKKVMDAVATNEERTFVLVAISRTNEIIIPKGETVFEDGDRIYFISRESGMEDMLRLTGKENLNIRNLMVLGGSRTGRHMARRLSKTYHIKLIEKDHDKCVELADELPDTLVIHGDGTDVRILEEEGIHNMDAFIAVTGNSETNIISCLVAKDRGVKKTIALVDNIEYLNLTQNIGINSLINKKVIAAAFIFRYIRKGDIVSLTNIHGLNAEVMELAVNKKSKITKKPIRELGFPKEAVIGGIIRNNHAIIPTGELTIQEADKVVVFARNECVHTVEKFFR